MPDTVKKESRLLHIDILRVLAIFLVIFNHTGNRGYLLFADETQPFLSFLYMMFSVFCKIAVPIFFMITGALLLPKQESYKQLFSKRVLRMIIVLLLISVPYYFWLHRDQGVDVLSFCKFIYGNSASTSLWYLYSYVGLLLVLPFLRSMVKCMKSSDFIYLIVGHIFLVGILPCLEYFIWEGSVSFNKSFSAVIFVTQNIFFAVLGYYLEHVLDKKNYSKKMVIIGILLTSASIICTCIISRYQMTKMSIYTTAQLEAYFNCFICIPAMTIFVLAKAVSLKINGQRIRKILSILGASVFGVYLIEKASRALTDRVYLIVNPIVGSFLASLIWCLAVCCISFPIIILIKHIPFVKRIVNKFI